MPEREPRVKKRVTITDYQKIDEDYFTLLFSDRKKVTYRTELISAARLRTGDILLCCWTGAHVVDSIEAVTTLRLHVTDDANTAHVYNLHTIVRIGRPRRQPATA